MKIFKYLIVTIVLAASGLTYAYENVVRLALIDYSDFREIGDKVYLSSKLPEDAEQKVTELLINARKRITAHYGKPNAEPVVLTLVNQEEFKKYGLNSSPGMLLFTPWNSYLLLNYRMADINITAHELVHAELVHRVGYLKRQFDIPTWFDEGAAMQVDYRQKYNSVTTIDQADFFQLTNLDTPGKFWSRDKDQNVQNYRAAKSAVSEIFKQTEGGFYTILARVRDDGKAVIASVVHKTNKTLQRTSH